MTDSQEITAKAFRANWPLIATALLGLIWAIRGEAQINANEAEIKEIRALVSVQGIADYAAFRATTDLRLTDLEQRNGDSDVCN